MSLNELLAGEFFIRGNLLFSGKKSAPIGFINPSICYRFESKKKQLILVGPFGKSISHDITPKGVVYFLLNQKAIVRGNRRDLEFIGKMIESPMHSRTAVWMLSLVSSASDFRRFYNKAGKIKIAILGCGGIGSNLAMLLAGSGIKNLKLIDGDHIEESNLNRQTVFTLDDLGMKKTEVLKRELEKRFRQMNIEVVNTFCDYKTVHESLSSCKIGVISANEPSNLGYQCSGLLKKYKHKLLIGAGYTVQFGRVVQFTAADFRNSKSAWQKPATAIGASSGVINYEVAARTCSFILQFLAGSLNKNKRIELAWDSTELT